MEAILEKKYSIEQLRKMIRSASSKDELDEIKKYMPRLTEKQISEGHKRLDDGIYDDEGTLIGEKHPND